MAPSSTRTDIALRLALAALLAACGGEAESGGKPAGKDAPAAAAAPVVVSMSLDWEGAYFDADALAAVASFRKENPGVPLTHFVCPAYYTKPGADPEEATFFLRQQIHSVDEVGMHLHAWNSLVAAAKVPVRAGRSYLTADGRLMEFEDDVGFDLEPSTYTVAELRAILATARGLLTRNGFAVAPVFRAGGWLAAPGVLEAARAEGYTVDASAVDYRLVGEGAASHQGFEVLAPRVRELWPKVDTTTQPFVIQTAAGPILEVPDSGALADHTTTEEIVAHVEAAARSPRRPVFVQLGFHAETAHNYAALLSRALAILRQRRVALEFVTVGRAAELAKKALPARP